MIWYNAYDDTQSTREVILYDEWDIDLNDVVDFRTLTLNDIGKFVKFTDGTEIYTKVIRVSPRLITTEAGVFRRADVVHCCTPKRFINNQFHVDINEVHPAVRPYTAKEKSIARFIIEGHKRRFQVTPRVKMLTLEKLKERSEHRDMSEEEIMDAIIDNAKNDRSIHWKWSMTLLMHAHGMDPNDYVFSHMKQVEEKPVQRITVLPNGNTLTSIENKIPNIRDIDKMIKNGAGKIEEAQAE